jgi:hypothetical protein
MFDYCAQYKEQIAAVIVESFLQSCLAEGLTGETPA